MASTAPFRVRKWAKWDWRVMRYSGVNTIGQHTWQTHSKSTTKRGAFAALKLAVFAAKMASAGKNPDA